MKKRKRIPIGTRAACRTCDQDIEWSGTRYGWTDRGGNTSCVPYYDRVEREYVRPDPDSKHEPLEEDE